MHFFQYEVTVSSVLLTVYKLMGASKNLCMKAEDVGHKYTYKMHTNFMLQSLDFGMYVMKLCRHSEKWSFSRVA